MIRVVSWNVLADAYLKGDFYPRTPPEVLDRSRRRSAVLDRLEKLAGAEVLCLQEVDEALFALAQDRLGDATGHHLVKRGRGEGVAIFVRRAVAQQPVFMELAFDDGSGHVALGVTFGDMTVIDTHLKWAPDGTERGAHPGYRQMREILARWPAGIRVVCGDLNADPASDVLALAREGGLRDAYASLDDAFTCNANQRRKRIDFILHTAALTATPSPLLAITDDTPLPGESEPSDHLPIEARLDRAP